MNEENVKNTENVEKKINETPEYCARLMAVQAVYQNSQNKKPMVMVAQEYLDNNSELVDVDGEPLSKPQGTLFRKILTSYSKRLAEIEEIINECSAFEKEVEPLLKGILQCGVCEILEHQKIDAPIIIDDYLNITHAFYDQGQVSLVNGLLDKVSKLVRS